MLGATSSRAASVPEIKVALARRPAQEWGEPFTRRAGAGILREKMDESEVKLAILAAILSLGSAMFVAIYMDNRTRWREKRAAAMVVIGELKAFEVFADAMARLKDDCAKRVGEIENEIARRLGAGLIPRSGGPSLFVGVAEGVADSIRVRPQLSDLFMQSAGRIMDTDDEFVWAHINVFIQSAQAAQRLFHFEAARAEAEVERLRHPPRWGSVLRPRFDFDALNSVQLQQAAKHARYARKHIDAVILSRCAFHNRVLRRAWTPEMREKRYREEGLREEGLSTELPKPDPRDGTA